MNSTFTSLPSTRALSDAAGGQLVREHRERLALEALEREATKRLEHAELFSNLNSAGTRIQAWEKVHRLRMPSAPLHPILEVIATATHLSLAEVQDEQQMRAARRASAKV